MRLAVAAITAIVGISIASARADAQSSVTLAPGGGHPSQLVTVSGTGFGNSEAVDVYVDTVDTLLLVSSSTGTFRASVTVPASASPGIHYFSAIGRRTGDAAQTAFNVSTPWVEFGYGVSHRGLNPYENTLTTSNVSSLGNLWSVKPAGAFGSGGTPAISNGRVITGTTSGIQAQATTTGALIWSKMPGENFAASPAISGSNVYVASTAGNIYALNAATGATIWSKNLSNFFSSPLVSGNVVYIAGYGNGVVYALNASTGATIWSYTTGAGSDSSPALANGIVYVGSDDDKVYALNASTGALVWNYTTGGPIESSPAIANGIVYVGSDDNKIYAIAAGTGGFIWSYTTGAHVYAAPAVAYGSVFIGSGDEKMYALDARSGTLQWSNTTNGIVSNAIVANGVVYAVARDGTAFAFEASYGGILASGYSGAAYFGGPAVSDGVLYIDSDAGQGYVSAYSLLAGTSAVQPAAKAPAISSLHPNHSLTVSH